mmetsp:Transcript_13882/g.32966  ORF Transcript_13882/g.32966 Transcript_13882/m.32966 type:complete len:250 (-) Transcript_13882:2008-2757(-)
MVHQRVLQRLEVRLDEVDDHLGLLLLDVALNILVPLDVLPHDGQRPLRFLVAPDKGVFVLGDDGLIGAIPELQALAQAHGAVVEATEDLLHVLDTAVLVFGNLLEEALLLLGRISWRRNGVGARQVARLFQLLLLDPIPLCLHGVEVFCQPGHHRERHGHIAADHLKQVLQLRHGRLEVHLNFIQDSLDLEERGRFRLGVTVQGLAQILQARLHSLLQGLLDPLVHLVDIALPLPLDVRGMGLEEGVGA